MKQGDNKLIYQLINHGPINSMNTYTQVILIVIIVINKPAFSDSRLAKLLTPSMNDEKTDLLCPLFCPGDRPGLICPSSDILPSSMDLSWLFFIPIASSLLAEVTRFSVFLRDICSAEALNLKPPFGAAHCLASTLLLSATLSLLSDDV